MLGVRHQPEDVALLVRDARDPLTRAVDVVDVPQDDLTTFDDAREKRVIRDPAALAVLDGDHEPLSLDEALP